VAREFHPREFLETPERFGTGRARWRYRGDPAFLTQMAANRPAAARAAAGQDDWRRTVEGWAAVAWLQHHLVVACRARFANNRETNAGPTSAAGLARAVGAREDSVQRKFAGTEPMQTRDITAWTRALDLDGSWITKPPPPSL